MALYRAQPDLLDRTFRRGARYLYYIVSEIEKRGLPMELALLPVVESAFNPVAYSRSRASGLWQFMPRTGRHYGLEQTWWLDERRDVIESTQAALAYLDYLHRYFDGDWFLAIAAYNGGEGTVGARRTQSRVPAAIRASSTWALRSETRQYVPKLLAIRRIVANPQAFGLQFAPIPNRPYFDVVDPGRQVHIGNAAELAGVSQDDMFALNPAYNRQTTPPAGPTPALVTGRARGGSSGRRCRSPKTAVAALDRDGPEPVHRAATCVRNGPDAVVDRATLWRVGGELKAANDMPARHHGRSAAPDSRAAPRRAGPPVRSARRPRSGTAATRTACRASTRPTGPHRAPRRHAVGDRRRYGVTVPELAADQRHDTQTRLSSGRCLTVPGRLGSYTRWHRPLRRRA